MTLSAPCFLPSSLHRHVLPVTLTPSTCFLCSPESGSPSQWPLLDVSDGQAAAQARLQPSCPVTEPATELVTSSWLVGPLSSAPPSSLPTPCPVLCFNAASVSATRVVAPQFLPAQASSKLLMPVPTAHSDAPPGSTRNPPQLPTPPGCRSAPSHARGRQLHPPGTLAGHRAPPHSSPALTAEWICQPIPGLLLSKHAVPTTHLLHLLPASAPALCPCRFEPSVHKVPVALQVEPITPKSLSPGRSPERPQLLVLPAAPLPPQPTGLFPATDSRPGRSLHLGHCSPSSPTELPPSCPPGGLLRPPLAGQPPQVIHSLSFFRNNPHDLWAGCLPQGYSILRGLFVPFVPFVSPALPTAWNTANPRSMPSGKTAGVRQSLQRKTPHSALKTDRPWRALRAPAGRKPSSAEATQPTGRVHSPSRKLAWACRRL